MKLSNSMSSLMSSVRDPLAAEALSALIRLLAPFAPHLAEELWMKLGGIDSVHKQKWPKYDKKWSKYVLKFTSRSKWFLGKMPRQKNIFSGLKSGVPFNL